MAGGTIELKRRGPGELGLGGTKGNAAGDDEQEYISEDAREKIQEGRKWGPRGS